MKTSKRILAALLALMLVLSLAACAKTPASSTAPTESKDSTSQTEKSYYNKEGLPICNDVITITVSGKNDGHNDWDQTVFVKEVEKRLGIKWDCTPYEADAWDNQFALMLSNDKLPDLIVSAQTDNKNVIDSNGKDGFFLDMNKYKDLMPNLQAYAKENPAYLRYYQTEDGALYGLNSANTSYITRALLGYAWLPKKWLKNVGMEVPNTVEELRQVLKAFKEKDANGNGDPNDEIPMSITFGVQCAQRAEWGLKFAFGLYSTACDYQLFADENGKVSIYETTDNYRKYMTYLNSLWADGLMDSTTFTQSSAEYRDKIATDRVGFAGDWAGLNFALGKTGESVWGDYEMLMTFESEVDKGRHYALGDGLTGGVRYFISAKTQYPEAICRMTDYWFTDDGIILAQYGVEGESFDYKPADEFGVIVPSTKDYDIKLGKITNFLWTNLAAPQEQAIMEADDATLEKMWNNPSYEHQTREWELLKNADKIHDTIPSLTYTESEAKERTSLQTDLNIYLQQMHTSFINGQVELTDKNWNDFQAKMNEMGLSRLLEIEQAAYDRLMKNS